MSEAVQIFNANTLPSTINNTLTFEKPDFLYAIAPDTTDEVEVDFFVNIILSPSVKRLVYTEKFFIDTFHILTIPSQLRQSSFPFQAYLTPSAEVALEIYSVTNECCLKKEMDELEKTVKDALIGKTISEIISNPVAGTIGAVAKIIIPALTSRGGFTIFNPSNETAYINFGNPEDTTSSNFAFPLNPGMYYVDDTGWDGNVSALTASGQEIALQIKEFVEAAPTP